MTKTKKIVAVVLCSLLVVVTIISLVLLSNKTKEKESSPNTIMTLSQTPTVQFVINDNNRVMAVSAINEEGQYLVAHEDFRGLTYQDAGVKFADLCVEAGYISSSADSEGAVVNLTFDGTLLDYTDFSNNMETSINRYFSSAGVIGIAIGHVVDDLETTLNDIYPIATLNFADKQDRLSKLSKILYDLDGITKDKYDDFVESYLQIWNSYLEKVSIDSSLFESLAEMRNNLSQNIASNEEISDTDAYFPLLNLHTASNVEELYLLLDKCDKLLTKAPSDTKKLASEYIKSVLKILDDKSEEFYNAKQDFDMQYIEYILTLRTECSQTVAEQKEQFSKLLDDNKQTLEENKEYYLNHRSEIQDKISQFRESFV